MRLRPLRLSAGALAVLALALLIGLLADALLLCLLLATLLLLGWHYRNLYRLSRYLWHSRRFVPPEGWAAGQPFTMASTNCISAIWGGGANWAS